MISNGGADGIADGATIAKIMYDKKYAMILTGVLSDLDLNFPDTKKVIRLIIRFINKLSRLSMTQKDLDQVGVNAQDIDYDYDEDSDAYDLDEDQPDIFRNSTLGMFEVDDEDEMYDDEVIDEEMETAEEDIGSEYHYQNVIDEAYSDVDDHESPESEGAYDETVDDSELEDDMDEDEDDMSVQSVSIFCEGPIFVIGGG
jgi:E3 ubiquitin-protein ligase HUWE1